MDFPRSQYLTSASVVSGKILKTQNEVIKHFNLSKANNDLQNENVRLRKLIPQTYYRLQNGVINVKDTLYKQQYEYLVATVIHSNVTNRNNFFTLDRGSLDGIQKGDGVFSDKGIVGKIHAVSKHYAVVKSVLTENINIDVMIESSGLFGILKWDGRDPRLGNISGISNDLKIKKWSKIVTKGGSGIFPRGLSVGRIEKIKTVEGQPVWDVVIRYSEDYRTLQRVYIVKNLFQEEQAKLESEIPQDVEE